MNKCVNCGTMHEGYTCHACGYVDEGLKEHLESEKAAGAIAVAIAVAPKVKCPRCGCGPYDYDEGPDWKRWSCQDCGYEDLQTENDPIPDPDLDAHIQSERERQIELDNRMVSLHLPAIKLYELQAKLCSLPKDDILDQVLDRIALLVEGLKNSDSKVS